MNFFAVWPYGIRRLTYADDTASARPLEFVEDYIRRSVLLTYANTHSENAASGRIMEKLGMAFERDVVAKDGWPYRLHRLTREQWALRRTAN